MRKIQTLMTLVENRRLTERFSLLTFEGNNLKETLLECRPGQFAQVKIEAAGAPLLRRPISINAVDPEQGRLLLLVRRAGKATNALCNFAPGAKVDMLLPLGNGFTIPSLQPNGTQPRVLLVGGGVGVAPLLFLGRKMLENGVMPTFLLGARNKQELLLVDEFRQVGKTEVSTDDGSEGTRGIVVLNPILKQDWDYLYCCGPAPMMKGIAKLARTKGCSCEVSLENMMACGLGACLCCVEKTVRGNVCVCKEGPVFNTTELTWFDDIEGKSLQASKSKS